MDSIFLPSKVELRPIPVSPNSDYMAGSDGNIYSRTQYKGFGKKVLVNWYPLRGRVTSKGYLTVSLCHENKKVTKSVHRLICMAFHGMPDPLTLQTRHKDGVRANNKPTNLIWGTQIENWADREAHGHGMKGEKHPMSKLTDVEREHLRWAFKMKLCIQRHAARCLGMSPAAMYALLRSTKD